MAPGFCRGATAKANIFASVCLGIIALTVLIAGAGIIGVSDYGTLDVPTLAIGIFMLFMGAIVAVETIKWIARIPKSKGE